VGLKKPDIMNNPAYSLTMRDRLAELAPYVGNTPLYPIKKLFPSQKVKLFAKVEWQQFGGSVKARPAYRILRKAVENGSLDGGKAILDATSGNTGIAYAIFCAVAGIPLTLCIPENASKERKHILRSLGAKLEFTSPFEGTDGAQERARELALNKPHLYHYTDQYSNDNNWLAHYHTTAPEIWEQTGGKITHFVAGLGTTGTFTGTGSRLIEYNSGIELIALQPESAMHGLEGWKHLETARTPAIFNASLPDRVELVDSSASYEIIRDAAKYEGLFLSPSAAANLLGAIKVAEKLDEGTVVTVFADNADKYGDVMQEIFSNN
jgi:cysteine synthase B